MIENGILLMQKYVEEQCGIKIGREKAYLIESRLSRLLVESGLTSFEEFYSMIQDQRDKKMSEKVIDAITTNETLWFRDKSPWSILEYILLPAYIEEIRSGRRTKVRIWSAACSTGQEPYSTAMSIDRFLYNHGIYDVDSSKFEIVATDISGAVLDIAHNGKYDSISMTRGLDAYYKEKYFKNIGRAWMLDEKIKKRVEFKRFNLQEDYIPLGAFDIIFCRYVMIYFSNSLQKEVLEKIASVLTPQGVLFPGSSEIFPDYKKNFETIQFESGFYYRLKG